MGRRKEGELPPILDTVQMRLLVLPIVCHHEPIGWGSVVLARVHAEHATTLADFMDQGGCSRGYCPRLRERLSD